MRIPNAQPITRRIPVPSPGANAEFSVVNDHGGNWLVRGLTFTLLTDANVASRSTLLRVAADVDVWFATTAAFTQTAGATVRYAACQGSQATAGNGGAVMFTWPTNGLLMPLGHVLSTVTASRQVGDTYAGIFLDVLEFPETYPEWLMPMAPLFAYRYDPDDTPQGS